jgi:hypothetical protein
MTLGLTSDDISRMLAGAGDRMEEHYAAITKLSEDTDEVSRLFSSLMVTISATVQDIVVRNNEQIMADLKAAGVLK